MDVLLLFESFHLFLMGCGRIKKTPSYSLLLEIVRLKAFLLNAI